MKFSKNVSFVALSFIFLIGVPSPIKGSDGSALLSTEDLAHEKTDRERGPALSSAINDPNPWATYNQWMCFDANQIEIETVEVKYHAEWEKTPQVVVTTTPGQRIELSLDSYETIDTENVIRDWRNLFRDSREICFFAAFLQYMDSDDASVVDSLWVLEELKTEKGYWSVVEANVESLGVPAVDEESSETTSDDAVEFDTVN